jgi:formate-dependent nitrite reductase cytochrome c552 subunit
MMKNIGTVVSVLLFGLQAAGGTAVAGYTLAELSAESQKCIECHKKETPVIYEQWGSSKHFRGNVGCYECHKAEPGDKDAQKHEGQIIAVIVSPRDCARCHEQEVKEFAGSHHAKAAKILGSLDNTLAEVIEGNRAFKTPAFPGGNSAAAVNGCWQCHGSEVKVLENGKLDPATWPNTGIGRINPDGSEGSCTACHSRHSFSAAQARFPDTCGKCHLGPDHPQMEIYNESKHGIAFRANVGKMNMDNAKWVPGEDYSAGPACATCHMSATAKQPVTHDVGLRISWNNRPVLSIRPEAADEKLGLETAKIGWEKRRSSMQEVCLSCHAKPWVDNFYIQYDALIELYHDKFAKPGAALMESAGPLLKKPQFSSKLDFVWYELWHHEGRRARHGASMMAPDYAHWHGTYEVARNFYMEFLPELEELAEKGLHSDDPVRKEAAGKLQQQINDLRKTDNHKWLNASASSGPAKKKEPQKETKKP